MSTTTRFQSDDVDPAPLAQPLHFEFSGRSASNRFLKAAMTERISIFDPTDATKSGTPSPELINLYRRWGEADIGLILTGNVMIDPVHIEAPGNAVIPKDAPLSGPRFEALRTLGQEAKKNGSLIVAQLNHPGRQVDEKVQPHPISASDVQLKSNLMGMTFAKPKAATQQDIDAIVEGFVHAAEYLEAAGWDGIQLHGAHGYLLSQFLSQTTNLRTDKYGGSIENRARIIVEIARGIRQRTKPSFILAIKLNSVEFQDKGLQPDEAIAIVKILEDNTFDFVELSGGTYEHFGMEHKKESTVKREAFFLEFADLIAPSLSKTKTYITGGFKTVGAMVAALDTMDGVGLGRTLAQEPRLVHDLLYGNVKGAIQPAFDQGDFTTSMMAAGTHIKQIGKDQQPLNMGIAKNVEDFKTAVGAWMAELQKGNHSADVVNLLVSEVVPYSTSLAA